MLRLIIRRVAIIAVAVCLMNMAGFAYAMIAQRVQVMQNPYGTTVEGLPPIAAEYAVYLRGLARGDFGNMPIGLDEPVAGAVARAAGASVGLLAVAFGLSLILGLILGVGAVRVQTGWIAHWLVPASTVGLAMPSFYVGALCIMGLVFVTLRGGPNSESPLPLQGFGWDLHLALPVLALMVRPTAQIASLTASLLSGELGQQYVVAARSLGNSWTRIRWHHALRPVLAPVVLAVSGTLRLLIAELIVVEWLFAWPGLGRLLALTLIAPRVAGPGALFEDRYYLQPPLAAALLMVFTLLFLLVDSGALILARLFDPRIAATEVEGRHG